MLTKKRCRSAYLTHGGTIDSEGPGVQGAEQKGKQQESLRDKATRMNESRTEVCGNVPDYLFVEKVNNIDQK